MDDAFSQALQALKSNFDTETGRVSESQSIEEDEINRLMRSIERIKREKTAVVEISKNLQMENKKLNAEGRIIMQQLIDAKQNSKLTTDRYNQACDAFESVQKQKELKIYENKQRNEYNEKISELMQTLEAKLRKFKELGLTEKIRDLKTRVAVEADRKDKLGHVKEEKQLQIGLLKNEIRALTVQNSLEETRLRDQFELRQKLFDEKFKEKQDAKTLRQRARAEKRQKLKQEHVQRKSDRKKRRARLQKLALQKAREEEARRLEKERKLREEQERKRRAELKRLEEERAENERLERERLAELERIEAERIEQERKKQQERERKERERMEQELIEKERLERERLAELKQREETERIEKERERRDWERKERERMEQERDEKKRLEQERLAELKQKEEAERIEKERKAEQEREQLEWERKERERLEKEQLERERLAELEQQQEMGRKEKERQLKQQERERKARERKERERVEKERLEVEKLEELKLKQETERIERERKVREERERKDRERKERQRMEQERDEALERERLEEVRRSCQKERQEAAKATKTFMTGKPINFETGAKKSGFVENPTTRKVHFKSVEPKTYAKASGGTRKQLSVLNINKPATPKRAAAAKKLMHDDSGISWLFENDSD